MVLLVVSTALVLGWDSEIILRNCVSWSIFAGLIMSAALSQGCGPGGRERVIPLGSVGAAAFGDV